MRMGVSDGPPQPHERVVVVGLDVAPFAYDRSPCVVVRRGSREMTVRCAAIKTPWTEAQAFIDATTIQIEQFSGLVDGVRRQLEFLDIAADTLIAHGPEKAVFVPAVDAFWIHDQLTDNTDHRSLADGDARELAAALFGDATLPDEDDGEARLLDLPAWRHEFWDRVEPLDHARCVYRVGEHVVFSTNMYVSPQAMHRDARRGTVIAAQCTLSGQAMYEIQSSSGNAYQVLPSMIYGSREPMLALSRFCHAAVHDGRARWNNTSERRALRATFTGMTMGKGGPLVNAVTLCRILRSFRAIEVSWPEHAGDVPAA